MSSASFVFASPSLPAGTEIAVRLLTPVSTTGKSGSPVRAIVTTPVYVGESTALLAGAILSGKTTDVRSFTPADGKAAETPATLRLDFKRIESGKYNAKVACVVSTIDNARETVDSTGLIGGIRASETFGSQIDRGLGKLSTKYGGLGELLSSVKSTIVQPVDPSIDLKAGVDLTVKLTAPLQWDAPVSRPTIAAIAPADALAQLATSQPFRTMALTPPTPSDITNLMFIGSAERLQKAFDDAGWFSAAALSQNSKMETARAIIENRGYKEAPMSVLTLADKPPDLALQKQTDTFAKRHHIRIWKRPDTFNGQPVWVAAATHDISLVFSKESRSFTHGIDPNIDGERSKVVNDLLFANAVHALALVSRPDIPPNASNATGDQLMTDGKIAVLELNP